jgi:GNAT superfamily N-acetyltransferase
MKLELRTIDSEGQARAAREAYVETLEEPIDGFWQNVVIANADFREILVDGKVAGHLSVTRKGCLVQFHVVPERRVEADRIFGRVLDGGLVKDAVVSTKDPSFLSLCLDRQKGLEIDCYLFSKPMKDQPTADGPRAPGFRLAGSEDIKEVRERCEPAFDGYYEELVAAKGLFVARDDRGLLGIGELRVLPSHGGRFADIGVQVADAFRGAGIGTDIVYDLAAVCAQRGLEPLCCCNVSNPAPKRIIEKAGFAAAHRLVKATFS